MGKKKKTKSKNIYLGLFIVSCVIISVLIIAVILLSTKPSYKEEYIKCIGNLSTLSLQNRNLRSDNVKLESEKKLLEKNLTKCDEKIKEVTTLNESLNKCKDSLENATEKQKECEEKVTKLESEEFNLFNGVFIPIEIVPLSIFAVLIILPFNWGVKLVIKTKNKTIVVLTILLFLVELSIWIIILGNILAS